MTRDVKGVIVWAGTESNLAIVSCEYLTNLVPTTVLVPMLTCPTKACLPMTRPMFRKIIRGSINGSKSYASGPCPLSDFTGSKGIKLSNNTPKKDFDDNCSQRRLAGLEDALAGDAYYKSYVERSGCTKTVISHVDEVRDNSAGTSGAYGIQVKNETDVRYDSMC